MPDESIPITPFQNEIVNIPKTPRLVAFIPFVFKRKWNQNDSILGNVSNKIHKSRPWIWSECETETC